MTLVSVAAPRAGRDDFDDFAEDDEEADDEEEEDDDA